MADLNSGRIGEQNDSYRKGLVLGLTMAEIGFLIIFVLLLLIAFREMDREAALRRWADKVPIASSDLQALTDSKSIADVVSGELKLGPNPKPEDVRKLVRMASAVNQASGESALAAAKRELEAMNRTRAALEKSLADAGVKDAAKLTKTLAEQKYDLENKEGQLKRYEDKLAAMGQGKGERPCWVRPDGEIEFLYDVVLVSGGIRMREIERPERAAERALLPMPDVNPDEVLSPAEFLSRTRRLYDNSLAKNCRFFVVIYDGTQVTEKVIYKSLLRTVEGHFYKRLSNASAPF